MTGTGLVASILLAAIAGGIYHLLNRAPATPARPASPGDVIDAGVEAAARLAASAITGNCPPTTRQLVMMFSATWKQFHLNRDDPPGSFQLWRLLPVFLAQNVFGPAAADPELTRELPLGQVLACAYAGILASGTHDAGELAAALRRVRQEAGTASGATPAT